MSSTLSVPDQIRQLNDARKLVLGDVKYYPSVVRGIVPIIGPTAALELRRWGAEFLAEAFATPALPNGEKETMQPYVLDTLSQLIEKDNDPQVLRSVIQTVSSIYPLALRWTLNNSYDNVTWEKMMGIKQRVLRIWEQAVPSVRVCCIKFVQRIVLAQSVASGAELRYGGTLDVSLDKIPQNHQLLDAHVLEAEATGLLDRMLSVLQDSSDALIVDATLNCMSILVRTRPGTSNRILNALLTFNPLKLANSPLTARNKVMIKSMEKTQRMLLIHLSKRDPHNPMVPRIQQHVEHMIKSLPGLLDDNGKKRGLEAAQQEGYDAKRQKTGPAKTQIPPLGPGPHSLADIFTLIDTPGLKSFDLSILPHPLITKIAVNTLARTDSQALTKAIEAVRARLDTVASEPVAELNPNTAPLGVDDDDDDYEPDFNQAEDTEQILNKLDAAPASMSSVPPMLSDALGLRSFNLPQPQALNPEMALSVGNGIVLKVLDMMKTLDDPAGKKTKAGFIRLAATSGSKDAWMTILSRIATRSLVSEDEIEVKGEGESNWTKSLSNDIRDILYNYIMEDFRKHIDVAVSWLCEEWYNDKLQAKGGGDFVQHYEKCALRLVDGFLPYLHPQDKILTRFMSEIPELSPAILARVKSICRDPSVVSLALTSLLYLVMMRPPVKEMALDTVQDIWTDHEDARPMAGKYLTKYRPAFMEQAKQASGGDQATTGTAIAT